MVLMFAYKTFSEGKGSQAKNGLINLVETEVTLIFVKTTIHFLQRITVTFDSELDVTLIIRSPQARSSSFLYGRHID